jgi:hypothetical protein
MPGVRLGAVVVAERADRSKQLVAFYSGRRLEIVALQEWLGQSLPAYMVPSAFHWCDDLPLTANGKVNRKSLAARARELDGAGGDLEAPNTPAEQRVAAAWAKVLSIPVPQVSRRDHFFDRGGTSLSAVKLVIALDSAVSLKDVIRNPVLADMARLVEARERQRTGASGVATQVVN